MKAMTSRTPSRPTQGTLSDRRASRRRAFLVAVGLLTAATPAAADVTVSIDATQQHQRWYGFGATTLPLVFNTKDNLDPAVRAEAIKVLYRDVRLTTGNLDVRPYESPPAALYSPANDNDDPFAQSAAGFNWQQSENVKTKIVDLGTPFGLNAYYLEAAISTGFEMAWANALRTSNYQRFLDECAEHVVAGATHWRDAYGTTPELIMPFNEPESGNGELGTTDPQQLVDVVGRIGGRLAASGLAAMRMVVPNEETVSLSLAHARALLEDAKSAPFVGAIGYHPYPYGSTYASIPRILATSGAGMPDPGEVDTRGRLRDLAAVHKVMVFMTEVSHGEVEPRSYDAFRGRAIHIHDELVYADASAYFGMNAMWDTETHAEHFAGRDPGFWSAEMEGDVLKIDDAAKTVTITGMGRAIGQYARWIPRGAVRIDAKSDDALVQVVAFRTGERGVVLVAINNATAPRPMVLALSGVSLTGSITGEQTTSASSYWAPLVASPLPAAGDIRATLPPLSVTTFSLGEPSAGGDAGARADGGSAREMDAGRPSSGPNGSDPDGSATVAATGDGPVKAADVVGPGPACACTFTGTSSPAFAGFLAAVAAGLVAARRRLRPTS